jgi:soluble lytic murein transglycosylase
MTRRPQPTSLRVPAKGRAGARPAPRAAAARRPAPRGRSRGALAWRRGVAVLFLLAVGVVVAVPLVSGLFDDAVKEITLPLRHDDIIRQQARDKELDPSLIAAVIYAESKFVNGQTSSAGAQGLMQVTPDTAHFIARRSGGDAFRTEDLDTPQVNISYGSYYLRYLLNRYGGNTTLAVAAYNAGEGNVDKWLARARAENRRFRRADIPFPETSQYVGRVFNARADYRRSYARELGL